MNPLAIANARKIIDKYNIKSPDQHTIEEIMNAEGLIVREKELDACDGNIVFTNDHGVVTINSSIKEERQKKFVAAHELGHFENERSQFQIINYKLKGERKKGEGLYICGFEELIGNKRNYNRESDANDFAGEFLMPGQGFERMVRGKKLEARLLKDLAGYYNVSLTAAAIRYSELGTRECAVVMSTDGIIKWSAINKNFTHQFIRWGNKVSRLSYVYDIFEGKDYPVDGEDVPAEAWFPESYYLKKDERVNEFNIPMPRYRSVLSVLWHLD